MLRVALVLAPNDPSGCGIRRIRIEPDPEQQAGTRWEADAGDDLGASHRDVSDYAIGLIAIGVIDGHHTDPCGMRQGHTRSGWYILITDRV